MRFSIFIFYNIVILFINDAKSYNCSKSISISELEQECNLLATYAVYDSNSYDRNSFWWYDKSGNCHNIDDTMIANYNTLTINEDDETFDYLSGTTSTSITWPVTVLPLNYTLFHLAKYSGTEQRIFQSFDYNWLSGFHQGGSGEAYHEVWITEETDNHGTKWVFSTDQRNLYRSNGIDRTIAAQDPSFLNNQYRLAVNTGAYSDELSDFYIAYVMVFDYELSYNEYICVEDYLFQQYSPEYIETVSAEASGQTISIECYADLLISITFATYGTNCPSSSDQTSNLVETCNGLESCSYYIDHEVIGDPSEGCAKEYRYGYQCMSDVATSSPQVDNNDNGVDWKQIGIIIGISVGVCCFCCCCCFFLAISGAFNGCGGLGDCCKAC